MRLNGKNFTIFSTDTITTIVSRIAAMYDSLPSWLIFSPPLPATKEELRDLNVVDYLSKIRGSDSLDLPQPPFPEKITPEEIVEVFIATNSLLNSASPSRLTLLLSSITRKLHKDPETIWRNRDSIIGQLSKNIRKNKTDSEKLTQKAAEIETIPSVPYTSIELDRIQFTVDLGQYDGSLLDLFNSTVPDKYVPYITCTAGPRSVYKVYRDFHMNPEWLTLRLNNVMLFKVNTEKSFREVSGVNKFKHYTSAALAISETGRLVCTMDAAVGGDRFVTKRVFLDRVLAALPGITVAASSTQDNLILSHFAFPSQCFDPVVFADLIMMNENLNKFVAIDEFARASRTTTNSAYVKRIDGNGASSLILKQTTYSGEFGLKHVGEWYVLCRMRTRGEDEARNMQQLLSKIISVYNDERDSIAYEYKNDLGSLFEPTTCSGASTKRVRKIKGLKGLRAVEPEIFYPTFTRKCTNPPVVVNNRADAKNQVMLFPTKGEVGRDGMPITPRLYTCADDTHKYIGLRDNDLPNKDLFPYVPCCFARDQVARSGSGYRAYFYDEIPEQKRVRLIEEPRHIEEYQIRRAGIAVEKPVQIEFEEIGENLPGQLSPLPPIVERFFQLLIMDPLKKFERCSVRSTKYSAIEAILFARGVIKYKKMRLSTLNNRVGGIVQKLLNNSDVFAMAAKQELYDTSIEEIKHLLAENITPSIFIRVIETLLDCNIFVFSSMGLFIPPHSRMYVKFRPSRETFFLFENSNDVVDIIGVRDTYGPPESFKMIFGPNEDVTKQVFDVFRQLTLAYSDMKEIPVPKLSRMNITEQVIDLHGKCRVIVVDGKITLIPIFPLPPFAAKSAVSLPRTTIEVIKSLKNCDILERRVRGNTTREVIVQMGSLVMTILADDTINTNIPISQETPKYEHLESESAIINYKDTKRSASLLLQNTINSVLRLMNDGKSLNEALRSFASVNGGLTDDNKRLLYACGHWIRTHPASAPGVKLVTSVNLENIPTAYVLDGEDAVRNLIQTYSFDNMHVFNDIRETGTPYFFEYKHRIYLAVLAASLVDANEIIDAWLRTGRVRSEDKMGTLLNARVYNLEKLVNDGDAANGCKILMVDDKFTALLRI